MSWRFWLRKSCAARARWLTRTLVVVPALLALAGCVAPPGRQSPSPDAAENPPSCYQSPWLARYACIQPVISKIPYSALRHRLIDYIHQREASGILAGAGVYFRDLEDGPHFGVNEYDNFAAASLLKLPVVIQYLSLAERDPDLLQLRLIVPAGLDVLYSAKYPPERRLVAGESRVVEDLLQRTIVFSDNVAFVMLRQYLVDRYGDESFLWESYRQLGLVPDISDRNYVISVSRYASMFKLVYSASYLNSRHSEKLIDMMRASSFRGGLVQGVPAGVEVAHKFGEMEQGGVVQLHDCGIVYYPGNPYVLCVMTRGDSYAELEQVLREVSAMVYAEVDSRRLR